jgi:nucleotide-binding universal stress UspA family protein
MFTRILVPLDGSRTAESVLPVVSFLARTLNASVTLVHVLEKNPPKTVHGETHLGDAGEAAEYLKEIIRKAFSETSRVAFHVHTAREHDVARSIVGHKAEIDHDLVVMCTHGRGRARHFFLGNIAQQVIHRGDIPVLFIHPGHGSPAKDFTIRSMLFPFDERAEHENVLPLVGDLAKKCGAAVRLAMVIQTYGTVSGRWTTITRYMPGTTSRMLELSVGEAEEYLERQKKKLSGKGMNVSASVLRGDPARAIVKAAQKWGVDIVVLGTHRKTGLEAILSGSVAYKICVRSRLPLLLIPV